MKALHICNSNLAYPLAVSKRYSISRKINFSSIHKDFFQHLGFERLPESLMDFFFVSRVCKNRKLMNQKVDRGMSVKLQPYPGYTL